MSSSSPRSPIYAGEKATAPARWYAGGQAITSRTWVWCLACITAVTVILYWRRPDAFYNPQFWAEDGTIFFSEAFFLGIRSLSLPYAGYFHLLARLVALAGSYLPLRYAPHWYVFTSWGLLVLVITYIFSARIPLPNVLKFIMGLALVATTIDNEVFFNIANWATLTGFFWLLLLISDEPRSRRQAVLDGLVLILAGLNSPFVVCLWPLFILRWWTRRTSHSLRLLGLSLVIVVIQVWNMPGRMNAGGVWPDFGPLMADAVIDRFGFMFLGERIYDWSLTDFARAVSLLGILGFYGAFFGYALRRKNWPQFFILGGGVLAGLLSGYVMRHNLPGLKVSAGRHFVIPAVTLAWALLPTRVTLKDWRWAPLALIGAAFLFWTPSSKNQVLPDLKWADHTAACVGTQPRCKIPINPVWDPPTWFATIDAHTFVIPRLQTPMKTRFGNTIELLGYSLTQDHMTAKLTLVWHAQKVTPVNYKYFVHIFSPGHPDQVLAQVDQMPLGWQYPTAQWLANEVISDPIDLPVNSLPPGVYQLGIGWYDPNSLERLSAQDDQPPWPDNRAVLPSLVTVP